MTFIPDPTLKPGEKARWSPASRFIESTLREIKAQSDFITKVQQENGKASHMKGKKTIALCNDRTFYTIQGEAPFIGIPAVFLRLTSCNLKCTWCDTPYTWQPDKLEINKEPIDEVAAEIAMLLVNNQCNLLVITGGEPLLQKKALAQLIKKVVYLRADDPSTFLTPPMTVQFETNGTVAPFTQGEEDEIFADDSDSGFWYVVSPKHFVDGNQELKAQMHDKFEDMLDEGDSITIKVVHEPNSKPCMEYIAEIAEWGPWRRQWVYLMPEGWTFEPKAYEQTAELAMKIRVNMSPRLHTLAWGDKRGV